MLVHIDKSQYKVCKKLLFFHLIFSLKNMHMYKVCFLFFSVHTYAQNVFYFVFFVFLAKHAYVQGVFSVF